MLSYRSHLLLSCFMFTFGVVVLILDVHIFLLDILVAVLKSIVCIRIEDFHNCSCSNGKPTYILQTLHTFHILVRHRKGLSNGSPDTDDLMKGCAGQGDRAKTEASKG